MIWGMTLEPGKLYTEVIGDEVHLSMASLESRKDFVPEGEKPEGTCHIIMKTEKSEYLLCTLANGVIYQQSLDLKLMPRERVTFSVQGSNMVYLTGYSTSYPDTDDGYEGVSDAGEWEPYDTGGNMSLENTDLDESDDLTEERRGGLPVKIFVKSEDGVLPEQPPDASERVLVQMEQPSLILGEPVIQPKLEPIDGAEHNHMIFPVADIEAKHEPTLVDDVTLVDDGDDDEGHQRLAPSVDQGPAQHHQIHGQLQGQQQIQEQLQARLQQQQTEPLLQQQEPSLESDQFLQQMTMIQPGTQPTRSREKSVKRAPGRPPRLYGMARTRVPPPQTFQQNPPAVSSFPSTMNSPGYQNTPASPSQQNVPLRPFPQEQAVLGQPGPSRHPGPGPSTSNVLPEPQVPLPRTQDRSSGQSKRTCSICGKTFADASRCRRHLLSHSQIRPFTCKYCDKSFHRKDHFKEHVLSHTRKFHCEKCGRGYSRKLAMRNHERDCRAELELDLEGQLK